MAKKFLLGLCAIVLLFILVLLFNTLTFTSEPITADPVTPVIVNDGAVARLQQAIQFKTISSAYPAVPDSAAFLGFHAFLKASFPLIDTTLDRQAIGLSLLYTWKGTDPKAKPVILMSHMDVVPVDEGTLGSWEAPPFAGEVRDGVVFGRGTMDDNSTLMAALDSVEMLLDAGFQPRRTTYLAFGHDEEIGGEQGAGAIGQYLEQVGIKAEFVIDEGGYIADGLVPGSNKPVAIINVAEKGFVSYELTINTPGGHSSMPPEDNTIGSLARAITLLENNQFEYYMIPTIEEQLRIIGSEQPFLYRVVLSNSWLFGGAVLKTLNARTTTAPTIIEGGVKDNVIPTTARAVVNFRVMPGQSTVEVYDHIVKVIADERITVKSISSVNEPSEVSDHRSASYQVIAKTIAQLHPGIVIAPGLLGGGTDTKHYRKVSENAYRFYPMRISESNRQGFHGINEHLPLSNYKEIIQFCYQLMQNLNEQ
jgi:carboxypeptidase PM20D1